MKSSTITGPLAVFIALFVHVIAAPNIKIAPGTASLTIRDASVALKDNFLQDLWKRRGGGGSGSRGSSSSGSTSSSSGSRGSSGSSGSRGSSSSSSSSRGGSSRGGSSWGSSSSSSSRGGSSGSSSSSSSGSGSRGSGSSSSSSSSRAGTGSPRTFGGGSYYAGGATTPYRSGSRSAAGLTGAFFAVGLLSFWPALWLTNAYLYHYPSSYRYHFHNQSSNANESLPVICACAEGSLCGCDENNSTTYFDSMVGNGSYSGLNTSVVSVAQVNGTKTLLVNGTLSNDTTSPTEDSESSDDSSMAILNSPVSLLGYWPVAVAALAAVYVV